MTIRERFARVLTQSVAPDGVGRRDLPMEALPGVS